MVRIPHRDSSNRGVVFTPAAESVARCRFASVCPIEYRPGSDAIFSPVPESLRKRRAGDGELTNRAVAVRERDSEDFVGMVGLQSLNAALPFAPGVEIVWRLHRCYWGRGYASEAANLVLEAAFEGLQLRELVALTARANQPSRALMARLGVYDTLRNFLHRALSHDDPLAEHVLYTLSARDWRLASRGDG